MESYRSLEVEYAPRPEVEVAIRQYRDLFVNRGDTYARQREGSRLYYRVHKPLTDQTLIQHLQGSLTVGLYSIDEQGKTKWSVVDCDDGIEPILAIKSRLAAIGVPSYIELSRAGAHLWIFWQYPIPSFSAKKILSPHAGALELFPAGDIPDAEVGLCIRGPLGLHRTSRRRYPFVGDNLRPVSEGIARGQLDWLHKNVCKADPDPLIARLPADELVRSVRHSQVWLPAESGSIRQWLEGHDIRDVIGQYVKLSRSGLGHCPWPEHHKNADRHPSFMVYTRSQRWWCFTSRTGGNAFDFLCRYFALDARALLHKLHKEDL